MNVFAENYKGFNIATELDEFCEFFKVSVCFYQYESDIEKYTIIDEHIIKGYPIMNLLVHSYKESTHIMLIKDVEALTHVRICPKCRQYCFKCTKDNNKKSRYEKHVKNCDGTFKRDVDLPKVSQPYVPHILNNKVYECLLAYNMQDQFKPQRYYITYDFETYNVPINQQSSTNVTIDNELLPFSYSICIHDDSNEDKIISRSILEFNKDSNKLCKQFFIDIHQYIQQIYESNMKLYEGIQFPTEDAQKYFDTQLRKQFKSVSIIGFNSSKFDSNLLKKSFVNNEGDIKWEPTSVIGSTTNFKCITISYKSKENKKYKTEFGVCFDENGKMNCKKCIIKHFMEG